jgi:hypothetical protein
MKLFFGYHSPSYSDPGVADIDRFDSLTKRVLAVEAGRMPSRSLQSSSS